MRKYIAESRRTRKQRLLDHPSLAPHGKASTYTEWGCRCEDCTVAKREYKQRRRG
jgi:hypothetical protein